MWYYTDRSDPSCIDAGIEERLIVNLATAQYIRIEKETYDAYYVLAGYPAADKYRKEELVEVTPTPTEAIAFVEALLAAFEDGHVVVTPTLLKQYLPPTHTLIRAFAR